MELICSGCSHRWSPSISTNQRLVVCPSCGELVTVGSQSAAVRLPSGTSGELTTVPITTLDTAPPPRRQGIPQPGAPPPPPPAPPRTVEKTLVQLEIADFQRQAERLGADRVVELNRVVRRVVRFAMTQFGAVELNAPVGYLGAFDRPVDAAGFAVTIQETMVGLAGELGLHLRPRIGVHRAEVSLQRGTAMDAARGRVVAEVSGPGVEVVRALMGHAAAAQVLMTRDAFESARANAPGNRAFPPGTRWIRHGAFAVEGIGKAVELYEVGRPGLAPMAPPGSKPANPRQGGLLTEALRVGTDQLGASLRGARGAAAQPPPAPRTSPAGPEQAARAMQGLRLGSYRVDLVEQVTPEAWTFLGRDLDVDRDVQLKVLPTDRAGEAEALARFTREGLTAQLLHHPNILRAYDMGRAEGCHYIAYERVQGNTVASMVGAVGPLQVRFALATALQVARGLAFAHSVGVVHRDIHPDTVMLSAQGEAKIVKLSLAKVRDTSLREAKLGDDAPIMVDDDLTVRGVALGNPQFIAPEQARDAATVDYRADQYALGALLYFMVAGAPPFPGKSPMEVAASRRGKPAPRLSAVANNVPDDVDNLVARLLEENPARRVADMVAVIASLEQVLGVARAHVSTVSVPLPKTGGESAPAVEGEAELMRAGAQYYAAEWARLRGLALIGFFLVMPTAAAGLWVAFQHFQLAAAPIGLLVLTPGLHIAAAGLVRHDSLARRLLRAMSGLSGLTWLITVLLMGGALAFLYLLGLLGYWAGVAVIGLVLAVAYQLVIVLPLRLQRSPALHAARQHLRAMREQGHNEAVLRESVWRSCPRHWEEFFEDLFGYEAMVEARWTYGAAQPAGTPARPRFATWRDPIINWLNEVEAARRLGRAHQQLVRAEEQKLAGTGLDHKEAARRARAQAAQQIRDEQERVAQAHPAYHDPGFGRGLGYGPVPAAIAHPSGHGGGVPVFRHMARGLCSIMGSLILLGYLLPAYGPRMGITVPLPVFEALRVYYSWGFGGTVYALLIGGMIAKNAAFTRVFPALSACAGALLLVATVPVVRLVDQPQFTPQMAQFCGWVLVALGLGLLRRLTRMGPLGM